MKIKLHTCELVEVPIEDGGFRANPYIHYIEKLETDKIVIKANGFTRIHLKDDEWKNYLGEQILELTIED